jgi:hypothetical protein
MLLRISNNELLLLPAHFFNFESRMQDLFCSLLQTILAEDGQPIAPPKMAER